MKYPYQIIRIMVNSPHFQVDNSTKAPIYLRTNLQLLLCYKKLFSFKQIGIVIYLDKVVNITWTFFGNSFGLVLLPC